ncbi:MAG TPA: hypothetical protein VKA34_19125 [Balneolales bacterium]|nr:hypothetical protein [Balneolales bacterium]
MQFDKWYFDFQNEQAFGYYYVGFLRFLGLCLNFTEIHYTSPEDSHLFYHTGLGCKKSMRSVQTSNARILFENNRTDLILSYKSKILKGIWENPSFSLPQVKRPVYKNNDGFCLWKVWTPYADVEITDDKETITGKGYIDFVRLTIPFWNLPFQVVHWGRLFSEDDWILFFHLQTKERQINYFADKSGWCNGNGLEVSRDTNNHIQSFLWSVNDDSLVCNLVQVLQKDAVLSESRMFRIPDRIRNKMSSYGMEEKFQVEGFFRNKKYKGIMEEVRWNEYRDDR